MNNGWPIFGILFTAVGGAYGWIIKHISNNDIHPSAERFVPNRVCDERSARIEQKVDGLKEIVTEEFRDVKGQFTEIKKLIRNNGH